MGGTSKRAAFAMVGATVMLVMSVASAGAGPSAGPEVMGRIESSSQKEILDRGLKVLVSNKGAGHSMVDVRGSSSTFDVLDFTPLTKTRAVRLKGLKASAPISLVKIVRLPLTAEGRNQRPDPGNPSDTGPPARYAHVLDSARAREVLDRVRSVPADSSPPTGVRAVSAWGAL